MKKVYDFSAGKTHCGRCNSEPFSKLISKEREKAVEDPH